MGLFSKLFNLTKKETKVEKNTIQKPVSDTAVKKTSPTTSFTVTGTKYYQDNFKKVLTINPKYKQPKSKFGEFDSECEYEPFTTTKDIALVEEPTNEFDPNAVYVTYKGEKLGYIKKGSATRVKNLMKKDPKLELKFYGGNVRGYINSNYDFETQKDILKCRIKITVKEV